MCSGSSSSMRNSKNKGFPFDQDSNPFQKWLQGSARRASNWWFQTSLMVRLKDYLPDPMAPELFGICEAFCTFGKSVNTQSCQTKTERCRFTGMSTSTVNFKMNTFPNKMLPTRQLEFTCTQTRKQFCLPAISQINGTETVCSLSFYCLSFFVFTGQTNQKKQQDLLSLLDSMLKYLVKPQVKIIFGKQFLLKDGSGYIYIQNSSNRVMLNISSGCDPTTLEKELLSK